MQRLAIGGAVLALLLAACGGELTPLPEGPSEATKCGYVEADEAAKQAREEYRKAESQRASKPRLQEIGRRKEAADQRREYAKECETRTREWSDLLAQQQSARAAVSSSQTAKAMIPWTLLEIVALLATIGVGIWAILENKNLASRSLSLAQTQFMRERRAWVSIFNPRVYLKRTEQALKDSVCIEFTLKNVGLSPAFHIEAVFMKNDAGDQTLLPNEPTLGEAIETARKKRVAGMALMPEQTHDVFIVLNYPEDLPVGEPWDDVVEGFIRYELPDEPGVTHVTPFQWLAICWFKEDGMFDEASFSSGVLSFGPD